MNISEKNELNYNNWVLISQDNFTELINNFNTEHLAKDRQKYALPIILQDMHYDINFQKSYYFLEKISTNKYHIYKGIFDKKNVAEGIAIFFSTQQFTLAIHEK